MIRRTKSKRRIIIGVAAACFLVLAAAVMSIRIKDITVTGSRQYTKEQMTELLFRGQWDLNPIYCFYRDRFKEHEQIPFVEDYKIVFQSPTSVEVIVYEKSIVGYVSYMGSYMYFDKDGIIVESSSEALEGIPQISGLKFGSIALHRPLAVENDGIFDQILILTQLLTTKAIAVDKIQYDSHGNATLVIGELNVYLGGSDQMSGKIAELEFQLPVMEGRAGTLYLDNYDEASGNSFFSFEEKK